MWLRRRLDLPLGFAAGLGPARFGRLPGTLMRAGRRAQRQFGRRNHLRRGFLLHLRFGVRWCDVFSRLGRGQIRQAGGLGPDLRFRDGVRVRLLILWLQFGDSLLRRRGFGGFGRGGQINEHRLGFSRRGGRLGALCQPQGNAKMGTKNKRARRTP